MGFLMGMEFRYGLMGRNILVLINTDLFMVLVFSNTQMELLIVENSQMTKDTAGVPSLGQMDVNMRVNGKTVIKMVLEYANLKKDHQRKTSTDFLLGQTTNSLSKRRLLSEQKHCIRNNLN